MCVYASCGDAVRLRCGKKAFKRTSCVTRAKRNNLVCVVCEKSRVEFKHTTGVNTM